MSESFHIIPSQKINGDIVVPGDKSISHRAVILSAISSGISTISNLATGTDVIATMDAMLALGVIIATPAEHRVFEVHGVGLQGLKQPNNPINCGNSGTAMRLLCGLLSAQKFNSILIGDESLMQRPMLRIAQPLRLMGAKINLSANNTAPIEIIGNQKLSGIQYESPLQSAQVKSAILIAGLYASGKTNVIEKTKTRDHTERMLENDVRSGLHGSLCGSKGEAPRNITIPGDISSAAFFIVLATLTPNADLIIRDVGINPYRTGILEILKRMGANIKIFNIRNFGLESVADIHIKYAKLNGIIIPHDLIASAIDEFPAIFIAAAIATGKTILRNATELRVKESDRIAVMAHNLKQLGITIEEFEDGLMIKGGEQFQGGHIDAKGDHRIAMAFAIAGHIAKDPISIDNCDFVKTSFPEFVLIANSVGMDIKVGV